MSRDIDESGKRKRENEKKGEEGDEEDALSRAP
jgi:hypothetical protein